MGYALPGQGRLILNLASASKLQNSHEVLLSADLESPEQYIICYAMCDDIGKPASIRAIAGANVGQPERCDVRS